MFIKILTGGCVAQLLAGAVSATDSDQTSSLDPVELTEIVITATRRDTTLEETPISITVLDQNTIDQRRITDLSGVAQLTPGLVFTPLSRQQSYPSIRGTTRGGSAAGSDSGVSVFIDEVPTTGVGDDNIDLFDVQSIQVYAGRKGRCSDVIPLAVQL